MAESKAGFLKVKCGVLYRQTDCLYRQASLALRGGSWLGRRKGEPEPLVRDG